MTRETIVNFHRRLYTPDNITLTLVGDIRPADAEKLALRLFGDWQQKDNRSAKKATSGNASKNISDMQNPLVYETPISTVNAVGIGWRFPAGLTFVESCAADLIAAILLDPQIGRVTNHLEYAKRVKESAGEYETLADGGMMLFYLASDPANLEHVQSLLNGEVDRLLKEGVTTEELELAKRRIISSYLFEIETYAGQARALGHYDLLNDYRMAMNYADTVQKVTRTDVMQCIRKYLQPSQRAEVIFHRKEAGAGRE
jgi:zinc protease